MAMITQMLSTDPSPSSGPSKRDDFRKQQKKLLPKCSLLDTITTTRGEVLFCIMGTFLGRIGVGMIIAHLILR